LLGEGTLGTLDGHQVTFLDLDLYAFRQGDRFFSNTGHGNLPLRLPDVAEHLAAHALPPGVVAGQHALRRREDAQTKAAAHPRNVLTLGVDTQAGLAHTAQAGDGRAPVRHILEGHRDRIAGLALDNGVI